MSDFERRVSEGLRRGAEGAPGATGLAAGARTRLRRRRRTTIAAAAAALVVVAVPVGLQVASGGDEGDGATVATDPSAEDARPAWRTESWRDATVTVPADWGHGALSAWCAGADGTQPRPVVQRPSTVAPAIACLNPSTGYGVQFVDARAIMLTSNEERPTEVTDAPGGGEADYPAGAWSGFKVVGGTMVQVVATDEETATAVYDSIELLEGPDANGCPQDLGAAEAADGDKGGDQVSLCGYSEVDELDASRLLSPEESAAFSEEVGSAPAASRDVDCPPGPRTAVLRGGAYVATVEYCGEVVRVDGKAYELTDPLRDLVRVP